MVKNKKGGNKGKKGARKHLLGPQTNTALRVSVEDAEMYASVKKLFGNGMCLVQCLDGKERICIIRNKFRGRGKRDNLLMGGTWTLVGLRDWEGSRAGQREKCDLLEVYKDTDKERLRQVTNINFQPISTEDDYVMEGDIVFGDTPGTEYEELMEANAKNVSMKEEEVNIDDI